MPTRSDPLATIDRRLRTSYMRPGLPVKVRSHKCVLARLQVLGHVTKLHASDWLTSVALAKNAQM